MPVALRGPPASGCVCATALDTFGVYMYSSPVPFSGVCTWPGHFLAFSSQLSWQLSASSQAGPRSGSLGLLGGLLGVATGAALGRLARAHHLWRGGGAEVLTRRREVAGHEAPAGALGRRGPLQAVKVFGARRDRVAGRGGNFEERGNCRRLDQILRAVVVRFDNHEARLAHASLPGSHAFLARAPARLPAGRRPREERGPLRVARGDGRHQRGEEELARVRAPLELHVLDGDVGLKVLEERRHGAGREHHRLLLLAVDRGPRRGSVVRVIERVGAELGQPLVQQLEFEAAPRGKAARVGVAVRALDPAHLAQVGQPLMDLADHGVRPVPNAARLARRELELLKALLEALDLFQSHGREIAVHAGGVE
mmetsp:Transcript_14793/g.34133  ORF Transcript_14793/g.34133 Transcript_14793/m.34133 type:complete len:368 (+) Transcript_14793:46-1149(+)